VLEHVGAVRLAIELARCRIQRDLHLLARRVAARFDAGDQRLERVLVRLEVRRKPALVADRGGEAVLAQRALERVKGLSPVSQRLREARGAARDHHELLKVDLVVGVCPAVEHVHHRHGHHVRVAAAGELGDVAIQRHARLRRRRFRGGQGDAEDRVGAQPRLVLGPVELAQRLVERRLLARAGAD
jgi:hypothetical protein